MSIAKNEQNQLDYHEQVEAQDEVVGVLVQELVIINELSLVCYANHVLK